jgi:hypothetical protein
MGKLDIGVGDDFPVDEPAPPSQEAQEAIASAREEWRRQKEDWRKRRNEWRAQRRAWHDEMHERRDAFRAEMRSRFGEHFGWGFFGRKPSLGGRILIVLGCVALAIALLPFLFMFGFLALAAFFFFSAFRGRHASGRTNISG